MCPALRVTKISVTWRSPLRFKGLRIQQENTCREDIMTKQGKLSHSGGYKGLREIKGPEFYHGGS